MGVTRTSGPLNFFKTYIVNLSPCSYHGLFFAHVHVMFIGNSQKEARYLSFKITADILIAFAGEFFTEEIEDTESL